MVDMVRKEILPAVESYTGDLASTLKTKLSVVPELSGKYEKGAIAKLSSLADEISDAATALDLELVKLKTVTDETEVAALIRDVVIQKMAELRVACDEAENVTSKKYWPFPTYSDLLFGVR